jgi:hypothetical protein
MKTNRMNVGIIVLLLMLCGSLFAMDIDVIAVHFGNPEYAAALSQEDYPEVAFYTTDGSCYYYIEEQAVMMKNPNYLEGYYGEVPEKMGFAVNYTVEKGAGIPYAKGAIYLVGSNGVIMSQSAAANRFNEENWPETYYQDFENLKKGLKNLKKGKVATPAKSMSYLKSTPIGEREPYAKSKIDKKGEGIVGFNVPEITVYDGEGNPVKLNELTAGKNAILVFYTMDGVHHKQGSRKDGTIMKEWDEVMPVNRAKEMKQATENPQDPKELLKSFAKTMGQTVSETYGEYTEVLNTAISLKNSVK